MSEHQYIQLPPDSTGKKLVHRAEIVLQFDGGTSAFSIGDRVTGSSSGVVGDVTLVSGSVASGELHLILTGQSPVAFIDDEQLQVESVTYAYANGTGVVEYIPSSILVGGNNPHNTVSVGDHGSLYVRYLNGNPALDITGRQEVVMPSVIGEYSFKYDKLPTQISEVLDGTASSTFLHKYPGVKLWIDDSAGSKITETTNVFHILPQNLAAGAIFTLWIGDQGKSNVRRRWGWFNENNGFYFELNGTTMRFGYRSSITGTPADTTIDQDNWNVDKLDGSQTQDNPSGLTLDVTKTNAYFIEIAGGASGASFGVYVNGERLLLHQIPFLNYQSGTFVSRQGHLPLRWEQENLGGSASSSEMVLLDGQVVVNGSIDVFNFRKGLGSLVTENVSVDGTWTHMFSIRAAQTYKGANNRSWIFPYLTTFISTSEPVIYAVAFNATVDDGTWIQSGLAEYNIDATSASPGVQLSAYDMAGAGEVVKCNHLEQGLNPQEAKLTRKADITADPMKVSVFCKSLTGAATNVTMSFTWMELY